MGGESIIIIITYLELSLLLILALISDIRLYKIKNKIILPFVIAGIITNFVGYGSYGLKDSLIGVVIPVLLLIILYVARMLGAGDIKLFGGIGAIMGSQFVIFAMAYSFLAGGVIAMILILVRKNARKRLSHLFKYLKACIMSFTLLPYSDFKEKNDGSKFHFAIAIVCGTLINIGISYWRIL